MLNFIVKENSKRFFTKYQKRNIIFSERKINHLQNMMKGVLRIETIAKQIKNEICVQNQICGVSNKLKRDTE